MKKMNGKKTAAIMLVSAMAVLAAGCGKEGQQGSSTVSNSAAETKEYVYVPEFTEIADENVSYYAMKYKENTLYYESYSYDEETGMGSSNIMKYSLADNTSTEISLEGANISEYAVGADDSIYTFSYDYGAEDGSEEPKNFLNGYDASGAELFSQEITDLLRKDENNSYVSNMLLDGEGHIYLVSNNVIWLFDKDGTYQGMIDTNSDWLNSTGCGKDGAVYITYYNNTEGNYTLARLDYDTKAVAETYENFVSGNGNRLVAGQEYDFLISDSTSLYGYDCESQSSEKIFDWLDSDINGSYVDNVAQLEDGRILAIINDWETDENEIALLTKTKASEVAQKETIVVGTMSSGSELLSSAVKFNKSNEKYRISIKEYVDYNNWSDTTWSDALTNLNNDITSNNCPDIIDLSNVNVAQLAAKGVFEDLNPYLENSSVLKKDDFVSNILEAYTYQDKLVAIPTTFQLQTLIGKASQVGTKHGWTLDEMIAFAEANPDAALLDYSSKSYILQLCMMYNESSFIDWNSGKCNFDTPEFKSLLEFVNRFPDEYQWEEGGDSTPTRIQKGEILLDAAYIYDFNEMQLYKEMFGNDLNCIGYPSTDGSSGTALSGNNAYAMTAKSGQKDGAWAFIETCLSQEWDSNRSFGFPSNKNELQKMAEDAVKDEYVTDENGQVLLDENGEPVSMVSGGGVGYEDGWSYTYRVPTQDEVDTVMELIETAKPVSSSNDEVINIILEEADAFFKGQKSVDDVANIIQSRINIYVSENS